jgi:hypothetical protein
MGEEGKKAAVLQNLVEKVNAKKIDLTLMIGTKSRKCR